MVPTLVSAPFESRMNPLGDEQVRDGVSVVAEVLVVRVLQVLVRRLEFDEDERDAVDKPNEVGPAMVEVRVDPELGDEQEVVVLGVLPVDDGKLLGQGGSVISDAPTPRRGRAAERGFLGWPGRSAWQSGAL